MKHLHVHFFILYKSYLSGLCIKIVARFTSAPSRMKTGCRLSHLLCGFYTAITLN